MISSFLNLLYPAACQVCGDKQKYWDRNLCETCLKKIKKRVPPFCIKCGKQLPGDMELGDICTDCETEILYYDRALSVCHYEGILKELVHNFKYNKVTSVAREVADLMIEFMRQNNLGTGADIVVSIPMHPIRLFKREINASELIAKNIAKGLDLKYSGRLLKKIKNTAPQSRLGRSERMQNIKDSFSVRKNIISRNGYKKILIVDDLFTTGSTVNECARMLKKAGLACVEVITLARGDSLP